MDIMTRAVTTRLQPALGQSIVVDNRPGAAGAIGAEAVAKAAPDGYTLLSADNGIMTMNPFAYKKLPYDPVKDLQPVSNFARLPFLLVVNTALKLDSASLSFVRFSARPMDR